MQLSASLYSWHHEDACASSLGQLAQRFAAKDLETTTKAPTLGPSLRVSTFKQQLRNGSQVQCVSDSLHSLVFFLLPCSTRTNQRAGDPHNHHYFLLSSKNIGQLQVSKQSRKESRMDISPKNHARKMNNRKRQV